MKLVLGSLLLAVFASHSYADCTAGGGAVVAPAPSVYSGNVDCRFVKNDNVSNIRKTLSSIKFNSASCERLEFQAYYENRKKEQIVMTARKEGSRITLTTLVDGTLQEPEGSVDIGSLNAEQSIDRSFIPVLGETTALECEISTDDTAK